MLISPSSRSCSRVTICPNLLLVELDFKTDEPSSNYGHYCNNHNQYYLKKYFHWLNCELLLIGVEKDKFRYQKEARYFKLAKRMESKDKPQLL